MGRLNKTPLEPDIQIQLEGKLYNSLARREAAELEGILRALLTPAEMEMLAKRMELLRVLSDGVPNKNAIESLKLSSTTVSQTKSKLRYDRNLQKFINSLTETP